MVYLDNAATTQIDPDVLEAMMPYLKECYGNPSTVYSLGRKAKEAIDRARSSIANSIGALPEEIYFTSGGTEADNWALKGAYHTLRERWKGSDIITSQIEHPAVLNTCKDIARMSDASVTQIPVDSFGVIDLERLEYSITRATGIISIMFANNEVGTIQPIKEIGEIARKNHIIFHVDAVQAYGNVPINVKELGIDLMSVSGHKVHAPKGIGFLYVRKGSLPLHGLIHGGHQERGRRAGTENVAGIVGLGVAAEKIIADQISDKVSFTWSERFIRENIAKRLTHEVEGCWINGTLAHSKSLPNILNVGFKEIDGESLVMALDHCGICISAGSACTSGRSESSHVLKAMGIPDVDANSSVRISLSRFTTVNEANSAVTTIKEQVKEMRRMRELYG